MFCLFQKLFMLNVLAMVHVSVTVATVLLDVTFVYLDGADPQSIIAKNLTLFTAKLLIIQHLWMVILILMLRITIFLHIYALNSKLFSNFVKLTLPLNLQKRLFTRCMLNITHIQEITRLYVATSQVGMSASRKLSLSRVIHHFKESSLKSLQQVYQEQL